MNLTYKAVAFDLNGVLVEAWPYPNLDMLDYAKCLKTAGFKLAILSNATKSEAQLLRSQVWLEIFDYVGLSADTGFYKPDVSAYNDLMGSLDLNAGQIIYLDDSRLNFESATKLGFKALYVQDISASIDHLKGLAGVL